MPNDSLKKRLDAVESKYDDNFPYEMGAEAVEKTEVRTQHMCEKWKDLLRFYSFKVSDFLLHPIKEMNTSKKMQEEEMTLPEELKVLSLSESINAATEGTSILLEKRGEEIKEWFKTNVSFQKIWTTMIEGLDKFPKINIPDVSFPLEEEEIQK